MRVTRGGGVYATALLAAVSVTSCTVDGRGSEARAFEEALQPLRQAKSFRMVGEFRDADGARTGFDARLDGRGACKGSVGDAESLLLGKQVWTRWTDSALPAAVSTLAGDTEVPTLDPVADPAEDVRWAAVKLLRGTYMVTALPGDVPLSEGIAPVCGTGRLLAGAATGAGDVTSGPVTVRGGERLRPLSRTVGPVTVRVYVPERGDAKLRLAEYQVQGGRSFSMRFSELGKPVAVHRPDGEQTIASSDIMAVLRQNSA
ncbi:hypothetical protein [Streptomyces griseorubiginosus]|uniref:hypothetical protein n=1 Tax=Streptomyces griseorubiginosus TaxID=67304 RepID=UPI002E802C45|nr:hypothetical protein [Streptomyces griseorubiginosus]WUB48893.1 hypothetical protein OHN19_38355 [Streptomyces griseorubiginosus]WUB57420.1 hypothetical protein OG942_38365 [Streptomyces griseorubiginosus]